VIPHSASIPGFRGAIPFTHSLPLALAGFTTEVLLGRAAFVGPFSIATKVFSKTKPSQKEQIKEAISRRHSHSFFSFGCSPFSAAGRSRFPLFGPHTPRRKRPACVEVFEGDFFPSTPTPVSTLIVLPETRILDFTTGDSNSGSIMSSHNLCLSHPAQARQSAQSEPQSPRADTSTRSAH